MPLVSAIIVLGLGLWLTINAITGTETIAATSPTPEKIALTTPGPANEQQPVPVPAQPTPVNFDIDQAGFLYLAPDLSDKNQLFRIDLAGGKPIALTQETGGVWNYALAPDGKTIAYITSQEELGGSDIWLITLGENDRPERLPCPGLSCRGVVWSPTGQRLIFETLSPPTPDAPAGLPSLWWLDMATKETGPVFQDNNWPGFNAGWSPDGQWLSYIYPGSTEIEIYNLADGRRHSLPNPTGAQAIWSPIDEVVLVADVTAKTSRPPIIHLFRFDLESETLINFSQQTIVSATQSFVDLAAAWSPDGAWVVVVRREMAGAGATLGSQLWQMRADGTQAHPLTTEPEVIHGTPVWSPDGEYLLFHRYSLQEPGAPPGIWTMNIQVKELREIVTSGSRPTWLP
jgi:Tol biopolymer transport system component